MNNVFNKLHNYLKNLSTIKFIAMIALFMCLVQISSALLFYDQQYSGGRDGIDLGLFLMMILFIIIDIFIFQYVIIEILYSVKYLKGKNIIIAVFSALLFAITHSDSWLYIPISFIMGLLWAYSYMVYKKKDFPAFWVVFLSQFIGYTIMVFYRMI